MLRHCRNGVYGTRECFPQPRDVGAELVGAVRRARG